MAALGLFDAKVPRYTSYPTAPHFAGGVSGGVFGDWIRAIPRGSAISLYVHVPFCRRQCTYCGCNMVVSKRQTAGDGYLAFAVGNPAAYDRGTPADQKLFNQHGVMFIEAGRPGAGNVLLFNNQVPGPPQHSEIFELDRRRAETLAARFPKHDVIHGDATDMSVLASEGVEEAKSFVALTGNDETNLMACLLAQELGSRQLTALIEVASNVLTRFAIRQSLSIENVYDVPHLTHHSVTIHLCPD